MRVLDGIEKESEIDARNTRHTKIDMYVDLYIELAFACKRMHTID